MSEKILCSVDLNDPRKKVCQFAVKYAKMAGAEIVVLFVAPSPAVVCGMDVTAGIVNGYTDEIYRAAREGMADFVAENFPGVQAEGVVAAGPAAETIIRKAKELNCSMIVMGTHGRKGMNKMLFGSVASRVVASAGIIPVVTIGTELE